MIVSKLNSHSKVSQAARKSAVGGDTTLVTATTGKVPEELASLSGAGLVRHLLSRANSSVNKNQGVHLFPAGWILSYHEFKTDPLTKQLIPGKNTQVPGFLSAVVHFVNTSWRKA